MFNLSKAEHLIIILEEQVKSYYFIAIIIK